AINIDCVQNVELFSLMCSICFSCYKDIFFAIYFCQTCKAQSGFFCITSFTAYNFAADNFGTVHILKHGTAKSEAVRVLVSGTGTVTAARKCLSKIFVLQSIFQKNRNIFYGRIMVWIVYPGCITKMSITHS